MGAIDPVFKFLLVQGREHPARTISYNGHAKSKEYRSGQPKVSFGLGQLVDLLEWRLFMHLTGYGENFVRADRTSQFYRGNQLASAQDLSDHINVDVKDNVCYDATAYMRFLLGAGISEHTLRGTSGQNWIPLLNFRAGEQWNGYSAITYGRAIGFYDVRAGHIFHSAIAVGDVFIRSINGGALGQNWGDRVDLTKALPYSCRNRDGSFTYQKKNIMVYISKV